ncbi:mitochondrial carrier [Sanghuangporus baumii]|uniref:Mitochondrial carrier n=1 Tax=Sanghuangporus baumii TaxID=108892 RepID=A0A9Q5HSI9_SANBA|nr:mitochondrial carrier [Sanghuangporus baumii]
MTKSQYPFWLGGVAASMAACCTHPLDLTKVRMQTLANRFSGSRPPSTLHVLRVAITDSGIRSLYTGLSASIMRQMSYSLVRLGSYDEVKRYLAGDSVATTGQLLFAAGLAGGLGGIAGNPADILLVRMTTDQLRHPSERFGYSNALSGLVGLVKQEGLKGLFRGLGTNTSNLNERFPGRYDFFKQHLLGNRLPVLDYQFHDGIGLHCTASVSAGFVATTICAPFDVMKSRLIKNDQSHNTNPIEVFLKSLRDEGPRFLFKGWTPAFIRLGPNTVLLFVFYEQLKKLWKT